MPNFCISMQNRRGFLKDAAFTLGMFAVPQITFARKQSSGNSSPAIRIQIEEGWTNCFQDSEEKNCGWNQESGSYPTGYRMESSATGIFVQFFQKIEFYLFPSKTFFIKLKAIFTIKSATA